MTYDEALKFTESARAWAADAPREELRPAVDRFIDFFSTLAEETVEGRAVEVYGPEAYFNDTLKTVIGGPAIGRYLARSLRATRRLAVKVEDVAQSGGDLYLRWRMSIEFKLIKRGEETRSIGMTQLRVGPDGLVVLQQDFWDAASGLLEHVPVVGQGLKLFKERL